MRPPHGARKNVIDRWSLPQNKPIFTKLCWTVTNVVVRTHLIYAMTIHVNPVQAVASCGSFFASLRCARGGCFDSKYGDKVTPFLAFCRQRQSLKSGGRLNRWSFKAGFTVQLSLEYQYQAVTCNWSHIELLLASFKKSFISLFFDFVMQTNGQNDQKINSRVESSLHFVSCGIHQRESVRNTVKRSRFGQAIVYIRFLVPLPQDK